MRSSLGIARQTHSLHWSVKIGIREREGFPASATTALLLSASSKASSEALLEALLEAFLPVESRPGSGTRARQTELIHSQCLSGVLLRAACNIHILHELSCYVARLDLHVLLT